jgi:hypothetical protein
MLCNTQSKQLLRVRVTFVVMCGTRARCCGDARSRAASSDVRCCLRPTALALAAALNPLLWRLWVQLYTGNANFVLATTIVHSLALTAGVVNIVSGACA